MILAVENITPQFIADVEAMTGEYYGKTAASDTLPPYDFDWASYKALEHINCLLCASCRIDTKMVGFAIYLVVDHIHHRGLRMAECDCIATDMHHRGKGIGRTLYFFCEQELKYRGVKRITQRYRVVYGAEPMFPKLGFKLDEQVYLKEI